MEEKEIIEQSPEQEMEKGAEEVRTLESSILDFCRTIFTREKTEEFFEKFTDEQKKTIQIFVSGFHAAIKGNIVGVYDYDYINSCNLNTDILKTVNIILSPIEFTDVNSTFVIVSQLS